jgi:hypothetical protein
VTSAAKLLAAADDQPMPNIGPSQKESVPVEGGTKYEMSINPKQNMLKAHAATRPLGAK